jgi:alkanesulfonate monooxygenase SsuD/methylene tetrahydromethanopterin reductase-like flavin-dependent oxidoreductase (luciferase family)
MVAKWGNACNVMGDADTLRHKFSVLRNHCETLNRPYEEITRSAVLSVYLIDAGDDPEKATEGVRGGLSYADFARWFKVGTAEQVGDIMQQQVDAGVNYFIVYLPNLAYSHEQLQRFTAEIVPRFA